MFFHFAPLLIMAFKAVETSKESGQSGQAIVSIVMSQIAAEAFINELTESLIIDKDNPLRNSYSMKAEVDTLTSLLDQAEELKANLLYKYNLVSLIMRGQPLDKSRNPFYDFKRLIDLRNTIVHFKPLDTFIYPIVPDKSIVETPKMIKQFQQEGLADKLDDNVTASWINLIMTDKMAAWSCRTVLSMLKLTLESFPESTGFMNDPVHCLRSMIDFSFP